MFILVRPPACLGACHLRHDPPVNPVLLLVTIITTTAFSLKTYGHLVPSSFLFFLFDLAPSLDPFSILPRSREHHQERSTRIPSTTARTALVSVAFALHRQRERENSCGRCASRRHEASATLLFYPRFSGRGDRTDTSSHLGPPHFPFFVRSPAIWLHHLAGFNLAYQHSPPPESRRGTGQRTISTATITTTPDLPLDGSLRALCVPLTCPDLTDILPTRQTSESPNIC